MGELFVLRKIIVSLLASVVFSICFAIMLILPRSIGSADSVILSFIFLFVSPIYLTGGVLYALCIDFMWLKTTWLSSKKVLRFFVNIGLYSVGGLLVTYLYLLIFLSHFGVSPSELNLLCIGSMGAVLFLVIEEGIKLFNNSMRKNP
ncbi:hypothetical protein [Paenibacillus sp. 481]|uniref:hypothetical protein n=1 Tax=Paenibacillus sp. 481 TaxID=2835869 RepID=UPI001E63C58B|nr:hypothetical protein [Paenibacillus sp. 481]UHA72743.1 hypothetical protein KIK04_19230 [Paenibacillus sp. 481]